MQHEPCTVESGRHQRKKKVNGKRGTLTLLPASDHCIPFVFCHLLNCIRRFACALCLFQAIESSYSAVALFLSCSFRVLFCAACHILLSFRPCFRLRNSGFCLGGLVRPHCFFLGCFPPARWQITVATVVSTPASVRLRCLTGKTGKKEELEKTKSVKSKITRAESSRTAAPTPITATLKTEKARVGTKTKSSTMSNRHANIKDNEVVDLTADNDADEVTVASESDVEEVGGPEQTGDVEITGATTTATDSSTSARMRSPARGRGVGPQSQSPLKSPSSAQMLANFDDRGREGSKVGLTRARATTKPETVNIDAETKTRTETGTEKTKEKTMPAVSNGLASLFAPGARKHMEEERLARAAKRKAPAKGEGVRTNAGQNEGHGEASHTPKRSRIDGLDSNSKEATHVATTSGTSQTKQGSASRQTSVTRPTSSPRILDSSTVPPQPTPGIQFPQGAVKKTWTYGCPRSPAHDDIKLEEVLQKRDLELAVLSSFQWDVDWLFSKVLRDPPRSTRGNCAEIQIDDPAARQVRMLLVMEAKGEEMVCTAPAVCVTLGCVVDSGATRKFTAYKCRKSSCRTTLRECRFCVWLSLPWGPNLAVCIASSCCSFTQITYVSPCRAQTLCRMTGGSKVA